MLDVSVTFNRRPGEQGYVTGKVTFADGSLLSFREFLDTTLGVLDKLMYSYHYQDAEGQLIFRYDNALHRPPLPARDHKHVARQVLAAAAPDLDAVLAEAATMQGWL